MVHLVLSYENREQIAQIIVIHIITGCGIYESNYESIYQTLFIWLVIFTVIITPATYALNKLGAVRVFQGTETIMEELVLDALVDPKVRSLKLSAIPSGLMCFFSV